VQGIVELITQPGMINVDFAHIRQLMTYGGGSLMSIGLGDGPRKAHAALQQAIHHPLLEMESLGMANGALVHFTGGESLTLHEVGEAVAELRECLPPEAEVVLGASTDDSMEGRAQVILIVTGVGAKPIHTIRKGASETSTAAMDDSPVVDFDDMDIPAFLRRRTPVGG
jgi:cell division protein FtsZ